jgi:hypothetical protein
MPKIPSKKTPNKSAFIRGLPAEMPAAEVVEKAKAANLKLTPAFVYAIRSKARTKGAPKRRGGKPGRKPASGGQSASDFVRSQPANLKATEVVAAGAKQGIKFSTNLVYAVRSSGGKAAGPKGRRGGGRKAAATAAGGSETTLRKLALDLGIGRAREILDDLEKRLSALISGS